MQPRGRWNALVLGSGMVGAVVLAAGTVHCSGEPSSEAPPAQEPVVGAPAQRDGPAPSLIMVQAQFPGGKPGPAKAVIFHRGADGWASETLEDPESNVWHKAMVWRNGLLTIGAQRALLKHWTRGSDGAWSANTLWEGSFGGRFDRLRDLEIADLDGDGADEMVIATHDMGVVAVGDEADDGSWTFREFDKSPDTFVHEVEVGDVDGDGKLEFYVTPSERNKASGVSQPGGVVRYDFVDGTYKKRTVVHWDESHAKEILVADLDGDGKSELYVAKEGHVEKTPAGEKVLRSPVQIVRMVPEGDRWREEIVATLEGEKQSRFLLAGDVNRDGRPDLVVSGMETGLWWLDAGTGEPKLVLRESGGFDHPIHLADLDGDGSLEIYAASEKKNYRLLRRFDWNGTGWDAEVIAPIPEKHITWNLMDGVL